MPLSLDEIRSHCRTLDPEVTEDMPFGEDVLVFRIGGKIFLLANLAKVPLRINLKCEPGKAVALREEYEAVIPGYHMNKKHWNTVILDGSMPVRVIYDMIGHSIDLVKPRSKKPRPFKGPSWTKL